MNWGNRNRRTNKVGWLVSFQDIDIKSQTNNPEATYVDFIRTVKRSLRLFDKNYELAGPFLMLKVTGLLCVSSTNSAECIQTADVTPTRNENFDESWRYI